MPYPLSAFDEPSVDLDLLRPGVDRLSDSRRRTEGLWVGHQDGWGMLAVGTLRLPVCVRPDRLREVGVYFCPTVSYPDFLDGYANGFESVDLNIPFGSRSQNRKPKADGMGFACGRVDALGHRMRGPLPAYNEHVRRLTLLYPGEHSAVPDWPDGVSPFDYLGPTRRAFRPASDYEEVGA